MKRLIKKLILFILTFLILGEIVVRKRDLLHGNNFFSNEYRDRLIIKNDPIIPYNVFGPRLYTKKDGKIWILSSWNEIYPLKKPTNTFRIVCFGGSTTYDYIEYHKWKIHYPLLLQRLLQKSVTKKRNRKNG